MVLSPVLCPHCQSDSVIQGAKTKAGIQRYTCLNSTCPHSALQIDLIDKGRCPAINEQIVARALHGSGIRDTARV
jgi:transposase-like protein